MDRSAVVQQILATFIQSTSFFLFCSHPSSLDLQSFSGVTRDRSHLNPEPQLLFIVLYRLCIYKGRRRLQDDGLYVVCLWTEFVCYILFEWKENVCHVGVMRYICFGIESFFEYERSNYVVDGEKFWGKVHTKFGYYFDSKVRFRQDNV